VCIGPTLSQVLKSLKEDERKECVGRFLKYSSVKFSEERKVCVEDPNHLSVKAQEKERPKSLKGESFHFRGRVDEIHPRRRKPFLAVRSGKVAWVLTLEVLWTLCICVLCAKETKFPEVPGTGENLDHRS
jgi:hypothetical protein